LAIAVSDSRPYQCSSIEVKFDTIGLEDTMIHQPDLNPKVMRAVQALNYRATVGDVAAKAGLGLLVAKQGILALASETGGHLQVTETGDIVYLFPKNFPDILRRKYFLLRLKESWDKIKYLLSYLLRISFGIVLIVLIVLASAAILIVISTSFNRDGENSGGEDFSTLNECFFPDLFRLFDPDAFSHRRSEQRTSDLNFLEAVFSFLFGDGNPNADLEERRWQAITSIIRRNRGAIIAEQIAPYLDELGTGYTKEYEEYMLPLLVRFDGNPEVTSEGQLVYHFPELQQMAEQRTFEQTFPYLQERHWPFSLADDGQIMLAGGLGALLFGLSVWLNSITDGIGGFVHITATVSLGYSIAYLLIPSIRYLWLKWHNVKIENRNRDRQRQAAKLTHPNKTIRHKLDYAQQFAKEIILGEEKIIYSTEKDLATQELEQAEHQADEWERRLSQSQLGK
jgi:hypothetical protein